MTAEAFVCTDDTRAGCSCVQVFTGAEELFAIKQ